jgi:hypothetical protein
MKFYYTTSAGENQVQKNKTVSLGGYKSASSVPNNFLNNLFGDISLLGIQRNQDQYIGLVLVNETGADVTDINLWFEYPVDNETDLNNISDTKLEVAAVSMSKDAIEVDIMEHIDNMYAAPYNAEFFEADGETNKVLLGDLDQSAKLGIWFKRSLLIDKIKESYSTRVIKDPTKASDDNQYIEQTLPTEDNIKIVLEWS